MSTLKVSTSPAETRNELAYRCSELFRATYGSEPTCIGVAPGRVNLIGEHTDYNGGFVLPAAIDRSVAVAAAPRNDRLLSIYSLNMRLSVQISIDDFHPLKENDWANYTLGVAYLLKQSGLKLHGVNLSIIGDIPHGAGLSSSAALCLANAIALSTLFGGNFTRIELAKLCQRAENEFVGVSCGIMDQFVSAFGKADHAVFLDCRSLEYEHVPIPSNVRLLVCDTGVTRGLKNSEYDKRRRQSSSAVTQLSVKYPSVRTLRDVSVRQFHEAESVLDPIVRKRARHVVTENQRVLDSVRALKENDLSEFGKLMYQSHLSLKMDFEVSCPELDAVVDICAEAIGVYGARMTGAGFGGSAICLVEEGHVEQVTARLEAEYPQKTGRTPSVYVCSIEDGASVFTP